MANHPTPSIAANRRHIFFLAKFFSTEEYANQFIAGRLYANKLSFFKELERNSSDVREDIHEGTMVWGQPGQVRIEINGHDMSSDLAAPVSISSHRLDQFNVVCLHAGTLESQGHEPPLSPSEMKDRLLIPNECEKFGPYAVAIRSGPEFLNRVKRAAELHDYRMAHGLVHYYDPETFSGSFPGIMGAFMKQAKFAEEREYRIVVESQVIRPGPLELDIGDITDIAMHTTIKEVNQNLNVSVGGK